MSPDLCILISTCERYRPLAQYTKNEIDRFWAGHPPVFFSGASDLPGSLPLRENPSNWMRLTHEACRQLIEKGFTKAYLILEDHPPMAACHAMHLNETLPAVMDSLEAICLALSGPGQHRSWHGRPVQAHGFTFDHVAPEGRWKFSLHPALWDLRRLEAILFWMIEHFPVADQNPWAFERRGGDASSGLPGEWTTGSFRVIGSEMARPFYSVRRAPRAALQFAFDVMAFLIRIFCGDAARTKFDQATRGVYCSYDGPYPLFWSGIMRKGVLSEDLKLWFRMTGQSARLARIPVI